jgi:nucleoside-diphosphate-sugar epimerase
VHLAAIRNAMHAPGHDVYRVNLLGTFHVFEAAAKHGIRRVVQASSINALGCAWAIDDYVPDYVPVDEDHPLTPTDPYSFSKQQIEDIGAYYERREGISSVALRLPGVFPPGQIFAPATLERRRRMREFLDSFAALPDSERARQIALAREAALGHRRERRLEYPNARWAVDPVPGVDERLGMAYMFDRFNLWASIDVRDAARAIEQAVTADYTGSHAVFANDTTNSLDYDSETLLRLFYPEVTRRARPLHGSEALVSTARARDLFGFAPQHSITTGDPYWSAGKT